MPTFDSPIGVKKFAAQNLKEFNVPDESDQQFEEQDFNQIEKDIKLAKEARRTGRERLSEGAKKRIELLIGMTRITRSVDLDGNIFILQTLKAKEMREAIMEASKFNGTVEGPFELRKQLLARSLVQIAEIDIEQFISSNDFQARLDFIDELDDHFSNKLYDEYLLLSREAISKYSIKNSEDAKEIVQDLKK